MHNVNTWQCFKSVIAVLADNQPCSDDYGGSNSVQLQEDSSRPQVATDISHPVESSTASLSPSPILPAASSEFHCFSFSFSNTASSHRYFTSSSEFHCFSFSFSNTASSHRYFTSSSEFCCFSFTFSIRCWCSIKNWKFTFT